MEGEGDGLTLKCSLLTELRVKRQLDIKFGSFHTLSLQGESEREIAERIRPAIWHCALNKSVQSLMYESVRMATHKVIDQSQGSIYYVDVVHSAALLVSMIVVRQESSEILALAHLLSPDHLPNEHQVSSKNIPTLSTAQDRAMVIMNRDGDYGVVTARWEGFLKCTPRSVGVRGKPGRPGYLSAKVFSRYMGPTRRMESCRVFSDPVNTLTNSLIILEDFTVPLPGNKIVTSAAYTVPEIIATAFSVANLTVLCNPDKSRASSERVGLGINFHKYPLLARGIGYGDPDKPSNRYLATLSKHHVHSHSMSQTNGNESNVDSAYPWLFMYAAACGSACGGMSACGASAACGVGGDAGGGACGGACGAACGSGGTGCGGSGCGGAGCGGGGCGGGGCGGGGCGGGCGG